MAINQKAIAEQLQLSTATVSRSLRNDPTINAKTRAKVLDFASRIGYQLPVSARKRQAVRPESEVSSLGVLISHPEGFRDDHSGAGQYMLAGISQAATQYDLDLTIHFVPPDETHRILNPANQPRAMRSGQLQGLILLYPFSPEVTASLAEQIPCVTIVHHHPGHRVDCVDADQATAISTVVEHLHGLGHQRIGFLSWVRRRSWVYRRFSGYVEGLTRRGLVFDPGAVLNMYGRILGEEEQADAVTSLVRQGVTAWVCAADHIAYSLSRRLARRGLRVGHDVSVTGYDGIEQAADCPALTTIRVPFLEMGHAAVRRLLSRLKNPAAPVTDILLKCEFVEGESSGPPPAPHGG
jgi:DNA-binding LacI/PurR family transcriptional regulator